MLIEETKFGCTRQSVIRVENFETDTYFVDNEFGNDTTAIFERSDRPWRLLTTLDGIVSAGPQPATVVHRGADATGFSTWASTNGITHDWSRMFEYNDRVFFDGPGEHNIIGSPNFNGTINNNFSFRIRSGATVRGNLGTISTTGSGNQSVIDNNLTSSFYGSFAGINGPDMLNGILWSGAGQINVVVEGDVVVSGRGIDLTGGIDPSYIEVLGEIRTTSNETTVAITAGAVITNTDGHTLKLNRVTGSGYGVLVSGGNENHISGSYATARITDEVAQSSGILIANQGATDVYFQFDLVENPAGRDDPAISVNNNSIATFSNMRARQLEPNKEALALQGGAATAILKDVGLEIVNDGGVAVANGGTTGAEVHAIGTVRSNGEPGAGLTYTGTNFEWSTPL